jgi:hypothetical protein
MLKLAVVKVDMSEVLQGCVGLGQLAGWAGAVTTILQMLQLCLISSCSKM